MRARTPAVVAAMALGFSACGEESETETTASRPTPNATLSPTSTHTATPAEELAPDDAERQGCEGDTVTDDSVTITHEPPSRGALDILPMFNEPDTEWSRGQAVKLLRTPKGPYKSGVHIDHVVDLGVHSGWRFQAVVVGDINLTQPVPCAPDYDPKQDDSVVCIVHWRDPGDERDKPYDCSFLRSVVTLDHFGVSASSGCLGPETSSGHTSECRLIWWLLPGGAREVEVVPTNAKGKPTGSPIPMVSAGQMHFAEVNGLEHYELRYLNAQGRLRSSDDDIAQGRK